MNETRATLLTSVGFLLAAMALGVIRSYLPGGVSMLGRWPSSATDAETAYKMMARADDPAFVSIGEAIQLQEKNAALFLDARTQEEYVKGRIPRALNLPFYEWDMRKTILDKVDRAQMIVVYCEGIGCELSLFLGRELKKAGFANVRIFYGGYPEWSRSGLPVEKQ